MASSAYQLTEAAWGDLIEILDNAIELDPSYADTLESELLGAFGLLGRFPGAGHTRTDLTDLDVRFYTAGQRFAVVHVGADPVVILRIVAWHRDISAILALN